MLIDEKLYDYKITAAGRVNIIGEHIDYCGGKVFPAALSLTNTIYVKANNTNKINISWTTLDDKVTLDIDNLESAKNLKYGNYQAGAALYYKKAGCKLIGCDMLYDCNIPFGSGLSSSAAIEVSTIAALACVAGETLDPLEIALLSQKAEREFAGVNCGIMDQYASACGKKNHAILLDCKTLECEYVPIDLGEYSLIIINSNKPHNLVDSKYNERREEIEESLKILKKYLPITCLAEATSEDLDKYKNLLSLNLYKRCKHVVDECNRVEIALNAMKNMDIKTLGQALNKSHNSLRDLYEVTGYELDTLASLAQEYPTCLGSRMTGAGFGGCTVSIVKACDIEDFKNTVCKEYYKKTGYKADAYEVSISDGITITKIRR